MTSSFVSFVMIIYINNLVISSLVDVPRNSFAFIGKSVTLKCASNLTSSQNINAVWDYYYYDQSRDYNVLYNGKEISNRYKNRISINKRNETKFITYDLTIFNIQYSDAGTYACSDNNGRGKSNAAYLSVISGYPICRSNIIGQYVFRDDVIIIRCSYSYRGAYRPILTISNCNVSRMISNGTYVIHVSKENNISSIINCTINARMLFDERFIRPRTDNTKYDKHPSSPIYSYRFTKTFFWQVREVSTTITKIFPTKLTTIPTIKYNCALRLTTVKTNILIVIIYALISS